MKARLSIAQRQRGILPLAAVLIGLHEQVEASENLYRGHAILLAVPQAVHGTKMPGHSKKRPRLFPNVRETYPTGTVYPTPYHSASGGPYYRGTHCSGWATLCYDTAFGDLPWRRINRPSWERPLNRFRFVCPCRAVCAHLMKQVAVPLTRMKRSVGPFMRRCGKL